MSNSVTTMTAPTAQANNPKRKSSNRQFTIALRIVPAPNTWHLSSEARCAKQEISTFAPKMVQHDSQHNIALAMQRNCAQLVEPMTVLFRESVECELSRWENEGGAPPSAWVEDRAIRARVSRTRELPRRTRARMR